MIKKIIIATVVILLMVLLLAKSLPFLVIATSNILYLGLFILVLLFLIYGIYRLFKWGFASQKE